MLYPSWDKAAYRYEKNMPGEVSKVWNESTT